VAAAAVAWRVGVRAGPEDVSLSTVRWVALVNFERSKFLVLSSPDG